MIKFRQKDFTIPEGCYTGPKDLEDIPGTIEMMGKGALAGSGVGAIIGGFGKDRSIINDALSGAKFGTLTGLAAKIFINYLHKPMTNVKYQEVDKNIRKHFGIFRISGITVGETLDKRASINEKFEFNDRDVTKYKINIAIHDNIVTLYTFGMTKEEFEKINKILDEYCKKFYSMQYVSRLINAKCFSYAVDITFTNYQSMCSCIMEFSDAIKSKINLLDNNAIIQHRLEEASEKEFSIQDLYFNAGGVIIGLLSALGRSPKVMCAKIAQELIMSNLEKLGNTEKTKFGIVTANKHFTNSWFLDELRKLHFVEGFHFTSGDSPSPVQISMTGGLLVLTVLKDSPDFKKIETSWAKKYSGKITQNDGGKVVTYTYRMKNRSELDGMINTLFGITKPNIFTT